MTRKGVVVRYEGIYGSRPKWLRCGRQMITLGLVAFLMCLLLGVVTTSALAVGDASKARCANEAFQGFRAYLPDCRAYELVSPPFKDGWRVFPEQFASGGSQMVASSFGAFAGGTSQEGIGNQYEFIRGANGWSTVPLEPPASIFGELSNAQFSSGPDISGAGAALVVAHLATQSVFQATVYLRQPSGSFEVVGPMLPASAVPPGPTGTAADSEGEQLSGASNDLSHILFTIEAGRQPAGITSNLWPGDGTTAGPSLYEYLASGHTGEGADQPTRIGVDNHGGQITGCGTALATATSRPPTGISAAGSTVAFTATASPCAGGGAGPVVGQLYARVSKAPQPPATINLAGASACSGSVECGVTATPSYQGASTDGSHAFFTTPQPLIATDHDKSNHLYECALSGDAGVAPAPEGIVNPCPALRAISNTGAAPAANVQSVAAISDDGSHVYYVATGVLATNGNSNGEHAEEGANNLYVYRAAANSTTFIGRLATGSPKAQTTPDGRFLVFSDTARLTPDDSSTAQQLFEYDSQAPPESPESLVRVSIGDHGFNNNGNTSTDEAQLLELNGQSIGQTSHPNVSSDGSKVVFTSADGLTPEALSDGLRPGTAEFEQNVYEYSRGRVFLISDGRARNANQGTRLAGITSSGQDIYLGTVDSLVAQDTDQLFDIYDAREGGGFPNQELPAPCVGGESCQPQTGTPPLFGAPSSASVSGAGNLPPPPPSPVTKPKVKPLTRAQKLAKALKACRAKHNKHQRVICEAQARKKYGPIHKAKKANRRGK